MNRRKSGKFKFNPDKPIINMQELDKHFDDDDEFVCALDCHNTFTDSIGALSIISYDEIINIKFKLNKENPSLEHPLEFDKMFRIKEIYGRKLVKGQDETYILSRDGKVTSFKSFKAIDQNSNCFEKVHYFESFGTYDPKYVLIRDDGNKVILEIYDSSLTEKIAQYDLMCSEDTLKILQKENDITKCASKVKFCVEYLTNITEKAEEFFNLFLGCDLSGEHITSILLASVDDRLLWIKPDRLDTKFISKGKILAIRYYNGGLMIVDEYHMLTVYYCCETTRLIKKNEIPLVGNVQCFRFYDDYFIYAAKYKMIIMRFSSPSLEPETSEISLGMVTSFTIVEDHEFLIAIDANKFFYFVPLMMSRYVFDCKDKNDFYELTQDEILKIPEKIKYLEEQEKELKALSDEFEREMDLNILLDHLSENDEFVGGSADIEFIPCLMETSPDDIVCNRTNSDASGFIKITVTLQSLLEPFSFTISCYRHTKKKGVILRSVEIERKHKPSFNIFIPIERADDPDNKIELFIHFKTEQTVLEFPMNIEGITKHQYYQPTQNDELSESLKVIEELMKKNNMHESIPENV